MRVNRVCRSPDVPYTGPFKGLQHIPKYYLVKLNDDTHTWISVDRLQLYVEANNKHTKQTSNASNKEKLTQSTKTLEKKTDYGISLQSVPSPQ